MESAMKWIPAASSVEADAPQDPTWLPSAPGPLRIAIVGRPNVGKFHPQPHFA
jgi:predicted GTPase